MARRLKSTARPSITSLAQLVDRLGRFAALSADADTIVALAEEKIAELKAQRDAALLPIAVEMKKIQQDAQPWWSANAEQLTDGKKKSVELAGCLIGERLSKPSLAYPKPEQHAIALIEGRQWNALLRVKKEMDKPAIMKALAFEMPEVETDPLEEFDALEMRKLLEELGFSIAQKEEFFIARVADTAQPTEIVADEAQQVAA